MGSQPTRRVGLSSRNVPQPLLKSIPDPVPHDDDDDDEDITAPPLASSDLENSDDEDDENAEPAETKSEPDQLFGDSSDTDGPARGAIPSTIFKSLGREGGRQGRQATGRDTNTAEESEEEAQPGTRKRKRNHLTDDLGFIKQAKLPKLFKTPVPPLPGHSVRKSSQFIVASSPEPSPIRRPRRLIEVPPENNFDTEDDADAPAFSFESIPEEVDFSPKLASRFKRKPNPLLSRKKPIGGRKKEGEKEEEEEEEPKLNSSSLSSLGSVFSNKSSEKDTSAPCPWCGATVDSKQLADFSKGKRLNVERQQRFCTSHKQKSAIATWESNSYPQVEWATLEARFAKHRDHLLAIINGEASHYRTALADKVALGQERTAKKQGNMIPGYYGPRGFNVMTDYLVREFSDMLMKKAARDKVIAGRGVPMFIESVLVAELGVQLIMEDMSVSPEKARRILEESKDLGGLVHPEVR
ncbi:hypothetical protein BBK36DRAFT_1110743 [Trichoderma citrinoviride]|uniref:Restriction of telomere capping protein 4 n=1 Tax=Trichoderma citrinoviride TaxID=58853 RepID=A0A2T4BKJ0_9HYPO|nr:hypothetical protein BBK36DRAFT_1110743 [Trichoderma citrinoviride]PTB69827.1 hypothetical protein BBK36DRAFT_1110743 [Trichoderma citrinoviride]